MPQGLADKIHQSLGIHFIEGYGLTETAAAAIVNPLSRPKRQCLGVPFFNTSVVIADPENGNLKGVEEIFLTGTAAEVAPVGRIDDQTYGIGPVTKHLTEAYAALVREKPRSRASA